MKPKSQDEKLWFFYGYFVAQADDFAKEFRYTQKEAIDILLSALGDKRKQDAKGEEFKRLKEAQKDRTQIMNDYYVNVSDEQFAIDIEKAFGKGVAE